MSNKERMGGDRIWERGPAECIVLPIDEANKCHRARDRGRRAWLVSGNHVGREGGRGPP